ncbi:uncharacterized protein RAG0_15121 [Rhynchosporium agropyri]|uniref:Apple domain-containing protein n=1 Tax=Rhynchosporium agropyri TaxID=914238 RepID=A0A1E1LJR5_9HELO|nr:uncharacterized protein RAG0_15121 [Rhynchosporium agropyri]
MKINTLLLGTALTLFVNSEPIPRDPITFTVTITKTVSTKTVTWSAKSTIGFTSTTPSPSTSLPPSEKTSPAKPTPTYPHGHPLCNVPNVSLQPGHSFAIPITHQKSGSSLKQCIQQCIDDNSSSPSNTTGASEAARGPCLSVLFEFRYRMCLFYDVRVEDTAQIADDRFKYTSWDNDCYGV